MRLRREWRLAKLRITNARDTERPRRGRGRPEGLTYDPLRSQLRFHQAISTFKGFSGPVGSGKSTALCYEAIRQAARNPGCTGLVAAPTYCTLSDTTETMLLSMLERDGFRIGN